MTEAIAPTGKSGPVPFLSTRMSGPQRSSRNARARATYRYIRQVFAQGACASRRTASMRPRTPGRSPTVGCRDHGGQCSLWRGVDYGQQMMHRTQVDDRWAHRLERAAQPVPLASQRPRLGNQPQVLLQGGTQACTQRSIVEPSSCPGCPVWTTPGRETCRIEGITAIPGGSRAQHPSSRRNNCPCVCRRIYDSPQPLGGVYNLHISRRDSGCFCSAPTSSGLVPEEGSTRRGIWSN